MMSLLVTRQRAHGGRTYILEGNKNRIRQRGRQRVSRRNVAVGAVGVSVGVCRGRRQRRVSRRRSRSAAAACQSACMSRSAAAACQSACRGRRRRHVSRRMVAAAPAVSVGVGRGRRQQRVSRRRSRCRGIRWCTGRGRCICRGWREGGVSVGVTIEVGDGVGEIPDLEKVFVQIGDI